MLVSTVIRQMNHGRPKVSTALAKQKKGGLLIDLVQGFGLFSTRSLRSEVLFVVAWATGIYACVTHTFFLQLIISSKGIHSTEASSSSSESPL